VFWKCSGNVLEMFWKCSGNGCSNIAQNAFKCPKVAFSEDLFRVVQGMDVCAVVKNLDKGTSIF